MKILIYNWTPLNQIKAGGGVAVYTKNLITYFVQLGHSITYIDSGYYYDKSKYSYIRENKEFDSIKSFSIINSPVSAPMGIISHERIKNILKDNESIKLFNKIIQQQGPFDVIHFQTLEGISPNVLSLKQKYPQTKFIHSFHDYGCFCMNVRFWRNTNENCVTCNKNENCYACSRFSSAIPIKRYLLLRNEKRSKISSYIYRIMYALKIRYIKYFKTTQNEKANEIYHSYRKYCIDNINKYTDVELAVSKRVKEIALKYGINEEKLIVNYIGTKVAEDAKYHSTNYYNNNNFTILYMGYANIEKGFYFLLEALEKTPNNISNKITIKFASRMSANDRLRVENLKNKYKDVIVYDGYSHNDFHHIFKDVNLGIVCPLWEDNLPQVTIEMIANGIPVITSSNGGAKELNTHPNFVFTDTYDFINKLSYIYKHPDVLNEYWNKSMPLVTMKDHIEKLIKIYEKSNI